MIRNYILEIDHENEPYCIGCESVEQEYTDELGARYIFEFPNGFTAVVVKFDGTHGWDEDLWEIDAFKYDDGAAYTRVQFKNCTDEEVNEKLKLIRSE